MTNEFVTALDKVHRRHVAFTEECERLSPHQSW